MEATTQRRKRKIKTNKKQGIYWICDKDESCWYVGQSTDIERRFDEHKYGTYEEGNWHNEMQARLDDFKFEIVELVDDVDDLRDREEYYIKKLKPKCTTVEANKNSQVGSLSEETKDKISENRKGKCTGEDNPAKRQDVRDKISANRKGKCTGENNPTKRPEVRDKIGATLKSHLVSDETKTKISAKNSGENNGMFGIKWMHKPNSNEKPIPVKKCDVQQRLDEGYIFGIK